jgi:hypothetical protein
MADIRKLYATNEDKETDGVWQDLGDGIEMLIARIGNPKYQKLFQRLSKPHRKAIRRGSLKEDVAEKLMIECMAETVLLGWKNVEMDGKPLPYSKENAIKILTEFKDLKDYINDFANEMEAYMQEDAEEAEENLKNS